MKEAPKVKYSNLIAVMRWARSKKGWISRIYSRQCRSSKKRGHQQPSYTLSELRDFTFKQDIFHKLHDDWVASDYDKNLTPSLDRLDDYKPYDFSNIRICTWGENRKKFDSDRRDGKNNKQSKAVIQMDLLGNLIDKHYSVSSAFRKTKIDIGDICSCCKGKIKSAGGFGWMYAIN